MASPVLSDSCDVVLKDGSTVVFRPSSETDVQPVRRFFESLSMESQYQRFLGLPHLDEQWIRRLIAETTDSCVLLACGGPRIVGVAGFYRNPSYPERAEVAFAIADALQGRGMGTRLLERLAEHARERNISLFEADVKSDNGRMLDVFAESGFALTSKVDSGVTHVMLSLAPSSTFDEKVATGTLSAVHPSAKEIEGHPAYKSVSEIPGDVDLAIVAVPAAEALHVVDDCIAKGVRGICVISAGFAETEPEGAALEAELLTRIRNAGCRLIGPNCMGLLNTDERIRLNATFSPV